MRLRHGQLERDDARRDEGSALILVLVLMVIGSLIVLPLMEYAMSVGRANTVLSVKTARTEAVKAGLRIAMAEPARLYDTCGAAGGTVAVPLSASGLDVPVSSRCYFIGATASMDTSQVRSGLATVQVGETVPPGLLSAGYTPADPSSTSSWLADTTLASETDKVWLPNLPVHGLSLRASDGWQMPVGFPECTVYFPGTYPSPLTIDGPTYFTSGIYYFEDTVHVTGGADIVVGNGLVEGCTTDQFAAFYAENAPGTHNINGLGGTFVFGDAGRLVVSNDVGSSIRFRFNERYVAEDDPGAAPSDGVSIVSVNGALDVDGTTGIDLLIPDVIEVPLSLVGSEAPVAATTQHYLPSPLVPPAPLPPPTVPDAPTGVSAVAYKAAVEVSWTAPVNDGNSLITGYTVRVSSPVGNTKTCATVSATRCVVSGLTNGTAYRFTVEATNAVGTSPVSAQSSSATPLSTKPNPPAWDPGPPLEPATATPIVEFALTTATAVEVRIPGYVSIPQGRFTVDNPNGLDLRVEGGVLAASMDIVDSRPAPVPIGLDNPIIQRTFKVVSETSSGAPHVVSSAIVQINQNGGWAINSWEVQAN